MKHAITLLAIIMVVLFTVPGGAANIKVDDLNIHGFVSQGFLSTTKDMAFLTRDSGDGTFEFNEMAINFSVNPTDNLTLGMQLNAFDLGDIGNDNVGVDWAFGDYAISDYLGVQAGIMKIPFGLYNDVRKVDMVRTSILLPYGVYPEWFREAFARIKGAGLYGTLPGNISYQAMYGNVDLNPDGGVADGVESLLSGLELSTFATDTNYAYAGKLQWDSPFGLKLAASLYVLDGMKLDMANTINLPAMVTGGLSGLSTELTASFEFEPVKVYALSAEYMFDRLTLSAEYTEWDLDFMVTFNTTLDPAIVAAMGIPAGMGDETTMQGYYGGLSYRVLDQLEVGTYYSEFYYDKSNHNGDEFQQKFGRPDYSSWLKDICLSARYDFSPNWCAKIEGHLMDGSFMAYSLDIEDWALYAAKVTYNF